MKIEAVKKNGCSIQYIKDPSDKVKLESVKNNGDSIQYIKDPSEAVQLAAAAI